MALRLAGSHAVEDLIKRLMMDISQYDIEILAEWYVAVAMDDKAAHDTLAAQPQMSVSPLVIECYEVEVLLRLMDALRNLTDEVRDGQQFACSLEKAIVP